MLILSDTNINPEIYYPSIIQWFNSSYIHHQVYIKDATHHWPFARQYSIWDATANALKFWTVDFKPHILHNAIEWVYTAFFCSNSAQQLWNLPEEILFSHFMTTLNDTFERELAQEDEGYESGSENLSIPTPVRRPSWIYHVSTSENLSFDPTTPLTTAEQHPEHSPQRFRSHSPVCCCLVFTSSDNESHARTSNPHFWHCSTPDNTPLQGRAQPPSPLQHHMDCHHTITPSVDDSFQDATAEDSFSTAPLDDNIWLEDPVPDRHLCIQKQSPLHYQCSYPCPYSLDLPHSTPDDAPTPYYKMMDLVISHISNQTLNMDYGLDEHLYSLNSLQMNYCWTIRKKMDTFRNTDNTYPMWL